MEVVKQADMQQYLQVRNIFEAQENPDCERVPKFERVEKKGHVVAIENSLSLMWQIGGFKTWCTFAEASEKVKKINAGRYAGWNDWRLPTLEEALSIIDPSTKNPAEKSDSFILNPALKGMPEFVWTKTATGHTNGSGEDGTPWNYYWIVDFNEARAYERRADLPAFLRLVRNL